MPDQPMRRVVGATVGWSAVTAAGCGASNPPVEADKAFSRPVNLVVPFGAGGGADSVARAVGAEMAPEIGTDLPVINVPGAPAAGLANMLASTPGQAVAVLIQDTLATVPAGSASFDLDEIRAVCRMQSMPSALFVRKGDFADWEDLAATAKEPDDLLVATVGTNSVDDIVLAALEDVQGTPFRAVPYSEPGYTALLSGEVDALYEQLGDVTSFLNGGVSEPARPHRKVTDDGRRLREVLTYSRRGARFTPRQAAAWEAHHQERWAIPDEALDDPGFAWTSWFGRTAPLIVEIGSGVGEATAALAAARPDHNVLGFEVWRVRVPPTRSRGSPRPAPTTCGSAGSTRSGRWSTASRPARCASCGRSSPTLGTRRSTTSAGWSRPGSRRSQPAGWSPAGCGGWPPTGPTTRSRWSRCWTPRSP